MNKFSAWFKKIIGNAKLMNYIAIEISLLCSTQSYWYLFKKNVIIEPVIVNQFMALSKPADLNY